jgi:hypothetical protein
MTLPIKSSYCVAKGQCSVLSHHYSDEIVNRLVAVIESPTSVSRLIQKTQPHPLDDTDPLTTLGFGQ